MCRPSCASLLLIAALAVGRLGTADGPPTPEESRAALRLADPALTIELVAREPEVESPVAIAWDERGRLFVAEMTDYPDARTGGRIKRLEDRDGDGRYESAVVFADGLHFPSGVLPWKGGILVTAAPDLLFLKDVDDDGKADVRRVVLTGFGEGNQQLRVNSPTWGLDNWVYLANGRSGGAVRRPDDPPERARAIPRNDLRVRPETGAFEPIAGFSQFGLPRDDWGDRFPSWNTVPLRHVVLEERFLARTPTLSDARNIAEILELSDGGRIYGLAPATRRFNAEPVAYFNASCGPWIERGGLLGDAYRGHALVCEPLSGVVHHRRLDPDGPTFKAHRVEQGREFLASTHPWFRPVNLAGGPDGALYVIDFCRALVEHPAFVPEAQRPGVDFREGHDRGRLWRIAPLGSKPPGPPPGLDLKDNANLVAALADPNGWRRDTAQRLLVERRDRSTVGRLRDLARGSDRPLGRVHALWTLEGLGALDLDTLHRALRDADHRVREQAARLAETRASEVADVLIAMADDPDPRVQFRVALDLGGLDSGRARSALATIASRQAGSPWFATAILSGLGPRPGRFLDAIAEGQAAWLDDPDPARASFLTRLAELIGATDQESDAEALRDRIASARSEASAFALILGFGRGRARLKGPPIDWSRPPLDRARAAALAASRAEGRPAWVRLLAWDVLLETDHDSARAILPALLEPQVPAELQGAAALGLARVGDPDLAASVLESWDRYTIQSRRRLLGALVSKLPLARRLVEAIEGGALDVRELDPATAEALRRLDDPKLQGRIAAILQAAPEGDRRAVIRRFEPALGRKADPDRGRGLFERHCQTCHARDGRGASVGPDLISVVGRPAPDLLTAILDPSREVAPDGLGIVLATKDGRLLDGLLVEESPTAVRLRRAEGVEEVVPRPEIEALRPTGRSLMPDGLEAVLSLQDMADLIDFLRRPEPQTAGNP